MQVTKTSTSNQTKRFICLCSKCLVKTRCDKTAFKELAVSMCGFPACIWLTICLTFITVASLCMWLTITNVHYQNKSYFSKCYSNNDCDLSKGLQCSPQDGSCNCPAVNTKARCDCGKGNYWNGINCSLILDFNSTGCTHDYQCDQSKDLVCLNGLCTCKAPKRWSTSEKKCGYNYLGCYWENNNPWDYLYYSRRSTPTYFVEYCIESCYKSGYKFATVYFMNTNNITFCGCRTTVTLSSTSPNCNLYCVGFTKTWICGTYNNWNSRPWFTTS